MAEEMRLPLSRARGKPGTAGHASRLEHARSFLPQTMEGTELLEIMFPAARKSTSSFVPYAAAARVGAGTSAGTSAGTGAGAQTKLPLRSRPLESWPESCAGDCLQCGERIDGRALPACNYKELERYWVFGQFCRPCCALGYVLEHWGEAGATRSMVWTRQMLSAVFGVPSSCSPSPPRFMLQRYGGPLDLPTFYGQDAQRTAYKAMRAPPLASFAMYMECVRGSAQETRIAEMPSMESLRNLRRPLQREFPLVTRQPTGRPPLLLELLATKFFELGLGGNAATASASVAAPAPASASASAHAAIASDAAGSSAAAGATAAEPKGKRARAARSSSGTPAPAVAEADMQVDLKAEDASAADGGGADKGNGQNASASAGVGSDSGTDGKRAGAAATATKRVSARKGKDDRPSMGLQGFFTKTM
jgi:hypothetical protein